MGNNEEENCNGKISIGMPIRNAEDVLENRLKSILAQSFEDFELIISDNCSEDKTSEICEKYSKMDKRIKYFKQSKNIEAGGISLSTYKKAKLAIKWILNGIDDEFKKAYVHYGVTRLKTLKIYFNFELRRRQRQRFIDKKFLKNIPNDEKFVFFPMQVIPERTVNLDAPYFSDQIEVITNIAKSLPVGFKLLVKEHFNMKYRGWNSISKYKKILDLPNVELIHPSINPEKIFEKCSLLITITSTAGFEATLYEKPVIVFGDVIYSNIKSVKQIKNFEDLPNIIRSSLKSKIDIDGINEFVTIVKNNSFNFDLFELNAAVAKRFTNQGFAIRDDVTIDELDSFFIQNQDIFEMLANEYAKRIT